MPGLCLSVQYLLAHRSLSFRTSCHELGKAEDHSHPFKPSSRLRVAGTAFGLINVLFPYSGNWISSLLG